VVVTVNKTGFTVENFARNSTLLNNTYVRYLSLSVCSGLMKHCA
jgi:hypothetical protein